MNNTIVKAMVGLILIGGGVVQAQAQVCPADTYRTFSALSGQSGLSQNLINNSNTYVGASRLRVSNTATGGASFDNNTIDAQHYPGTSTIPSEPGIRIGQNNTSPSSVLVTDMEFRDPADLTVWRPVSNLSLRLHDIDAGDNVTVNAYDQNGNLITLTSANYSFDSSNGAPYVSYAGGNRFTAPSGDSPNNQRRGTVNLTFNGLQIRRIEFRYYDTTSSGTYTIAELRGCSVPITLSKVTQPIAGGPFGFALTNTTQTTATVTTTSAGSPTQVDGDALAGVQPFTVAAPGGQVTITENALPNGWSLVDATCTNASGATVGTRNNATYTLPPASTVAGEALWCTFTNSRTTLRLQKALPAGRAQATDQFTLSIAGTGAPAAVTTTGSDTTAAGVVTHATATANSAYTLSETAAGGAVLANYATTYACTNTRPGGQTPSGTGTSFAIVPAAGDDLTCTFINTKRPRVTVRKISVNGTDSFSFSGTNGVASQTLVTATSGVPVAGAPQVLSAASTVTTITEGAPPANYRLTDIACTGLPPGGNAAVNLAARQVVLDAAATTAGADVVCTFTNTLFRADVRVSKTATPTSAQSGATVTYTITVNNDGPVAADGTLLTDVPGAGLDCIAPSSTFTCTATGGAACPAVTVPVTTLLGTGMLIPSLPVGGQVTATLLCRATATGFP
ncbi:prealbumin-like fold domain-containing protein [Pseudoxanthomonas sp.]|uniref:prealbumin-like fold domain-containing protein n=1 Tax=Pseudoxanthomonas sp. TaxID=1871049 RepID=UPI002E0E044B|nr:hypothetical protein [Pseudoxanthomonas sp.]